MQQDARSPKVVPDTRGRLPPISGSKPAVEPYALPQPAEDLHSTPTQKTPALELVSQNQDTSTDAQKLQALYQLIEKATGVSVGPDSDAEAQFEQAQRALLQTKSVKWHRLTNGSVAAGRENRVMKKAVSISAFNDISGFPQHNANTRFAGSAMNPSTGMVRVKTSGGLCGCCRRKGAAKENWFNKHTVLFRSCFTVLAWVWIATAFFYFYSGWIDPRMFDVNQKLLADLVNSTGGDADVLAKTLPDNPAFKNKWTLAMAFYYAVQSGFSVGFGALVEVDDWSRLYTIFHVLFGASIVSGALTVFSMKLIDDAIKRSEEIQESMMGNASNPDQASYKNMTPKEVAQSMYNNQRKPWRKKCCCLSTEYVLAFALLVWVGAGAFGAHTQWNLSYINSAYFAITALSTAGLHAPGDLDDMSMWATGGFVFFGVPMFGLVLGSIASVMVNPYMERKFLKKFNKASKLDVGSFLEAVAGGDDDVLTYGEYLEFCMLNAYDAKPGQVRQLRSTFHSMDGSLMKDGRVTRRELMRWVVEHEEKKDSPNLN